jgi:hypothetical protein
MDLMMEMIEYVAPRVRVRGVFCVENWAVSEASFKYGKLELEDWAADPTPAAPSRKGDVSVYF